VPVGFEARDNGVLVRFNQPVKDADAATCFAQCWNYQYGPQYGSPEYSVKHADTPGHDPLEVRSVQTLDGGKTLFIEIPQLVTASQIHLRVSTGHDLFLTAHALAEPFTDFPDYTKIAKTNHAAQSRHHCAHPFQTQPLGQRRVRTRDRGRSCAGPPIRAKTAHRQTRRKTDPPSSKIPTWCRTTGCSPNPAPCKS
jgi:hypothetical protein